MDNGPWKGNAPFNRVEGGPIHAEPNGELNSAQLKSVFPIS